MGVGGVTGEAFGPAGVAGQRFMPGAIGSTQITQQACGVAGTAGTFAEGLSFSSATQSWRLKLPASGLNV